MTIFSSAPLEHQRRFILTVNLSTWDCLESLSHSLADISESFGSFTVYDASLKQIVETHLDAHTFWQASPGRMSLAPTIRTARLPAFKESTSKQNSDPVVLEALNISRSSNWTSPIHV
jgi:hypothetical protein